MKIERLRTNHIKKPIGFALGRPMRSWVVRESAGKRQKTARIRLAADPRMEDILFDSRPDANISSIAYRLPDAVELEPGVRYYWDVSVEADNGDFAISAPAFFEMPVVMRSLPGEMIACAENLDVCEFFHTVNIAGSVKQARAYVTALGVFELRINGEKAGEEYLTPYSNDYDSWQQVITFDVTGLLRPGENEISAVVAPGWYSGYFGFEGKHNIYGDRLGLLLHLDVEYEDGGQQGLSTGPSWKARECPVRYAEIYHGEVFEPGYVPDTVYGTEALPFDKGKLEPRRSLPVVVKERLDPVGILHTPKGETVIDMGQNMVGWLSFVCREPERAKVHLQYGEVLQDGCFYRDNLRAARAEFTYVSDGTQRTVRPHLTYYGFRYVKIEGQAKEPALEDLCGEVIYSDMDSSGWIETGSPLVNRLFLNALWGQKGNFVDVPSDCPQRDERMGWTGDAQVFAGTASFNMDAYAFYSKYGYDMLREQENCDGCVPMTIPSFHMGPGGSAAWADAATVIPWTAYVYSGDKAILEQQYPSMKGWVGYIRRQDEQAGGRGLWQTGFHFGDWLALDGEDPNFPTGGTDVYYVASAYYYLSVTLTAKAAGVLGYAGDAEDLERLAEKIKTAIQKEYFTETGRLAVPTQTGYVLALAFGFCPEEFQDRLAADLKSKLEHNGGKLKTGFVGTPQLCRVLSDNGCNELAYSLLLNEDCPGWLYPVRMGATTIWERWDSVLPDGRMNPEGMNSLNHYAYGSIVEWMYRCMGGINPAEDAPGFVKIRWAPRPDRRLAWARVRCAAPIGVYESGWRYEGEELCLCLTVPFGGSAVLDLPNAPEGNVLCNGGALESPELKTGTYEIRYVPTA